MAQICQVCNHPKRLEIDRQLVQGISHTRISREYDVSINSVMRHAENHLSRQLVKSMEMKQAMQNAGLVNEIESLLNKSKSILNKAEADGKLNLALNAIRETRGTLELMAKICATIYQIQAQELQAQQGIDDDTTRAQEGLEKLTDLELDMLIALTEKMRGERKDDVVRAVMQEAKLNYHPAPKLASRRSGRRLPASYDDTWSDEREQQAQAEEIALAEIEPEPLEPLAHKPLDLDELSLTEQAHAGTWGERDNPLKRTADPGSIRTTDPQLRRLYGLD